MLQFDLTGWWIVQRWHAMLRALLQVSFGLCSSVLTRVISPQRSPPLDSGDVHAMKLLFALRRARTLSHAIILSCVLLGACAPVPLLLIGAGSTAYLVEDRRSSDTIIGDNRIDLTVKGKIANQVVESDSIATTVFNHKVLLTGQVTSAALRTKATSLASSVDGVREVYDQIEVINPPVVSSAPPNLVLSTKVKSRMVGVKGLNALHVTITSDRGVVYLMGLVTPAEADIATHIAATTADVKRVVRLFELLPAETQPAPVISSPSEPAVR